MPFSGAQARRSSSSFLLVFIIVVVVVVGALLATNVACYDFGNCQWGRGGTLDRHFPTSTTVKSFHFMVMRHGSLAAWPG